MLSNSNTAPTSRLTVTIVVATIVSLLLLLVTFSNQLGTPLHKAKEILKPDAQSTIYNCEDPYRRPGYLYIDDKDYKNTRWIPYTDDFLDAEIPSFAEYPALEGTDTFFNVTGVEKQFIEPATTPQQWMHRVLAEDKRRRELPGSDQTEHDQDGVEDYVGMKDDGDLSWLWGRRVLLLGDSVDRFMMQFFCEEFGRKMRQPAPHTTATCEIPTLNLTIIHWHFAGSWTYRPEWWWMNDMKAIAFEDRWEKYWRPMLDTHVRGPNGRPDLLLWQNGLWDQRALWESDEAHSTATTQEKLAHRERQMMWQEIRFIAARIKKFVASLSDEFGADMPTMFRAITVHRNSNATDANIYELDRVSRAVAEKAGHETFEWGRIITAFSMLYMDKTHTGKGPASWLWGNMVLEYLARSAGAGDEERAPYFDGWEACHARLNHWGGR